jgi:hypothetical protein
MSSFPGFLTADWFSPQNASLLRRCIRGRIHRLLAEQARGEGAEAAAAELRRLADEEEDPTKQE